MIKGKQQTFMNFWTHIYINYVICRLGFTCGTLLTSIFFWFGLSKAMLHLVCFFSTQHTRHHELKPNCSMMWKLEMGSLGWSPMLTHLCMVWPANKMFMSRELMQSKECVFRAVLYVTRELPV